jgi:CcmD family protein
MTEEQKFWYLFIAYAIIWLLIGGYLLWLGARQRSNRRVIERLRAMLGPDSDEAASDRRSP